MNNGNSSETQPGLLNPLSEDELDRLERALDLVGPSWGIAARLMGRLGLRVGEVQKLSWTHVDIYFPCDPSLHITAPITKTGYARTLPIPTGLTELLTQHRHHAQALWAEEYKGVETPTPETNFLNSPVVRKKDGTRPSIRWMQIIIIKTARAAIGRKIKPHTLRHTFATRLLQRTNIRVVQAALGHRSLQSTQIYTHPTLGDLRKAIQETEEGNV